MKRQFTCRHGDIPSKEPGQYSSWRLSLYFQLIDIVSNDAEGYSKKKSDRLFTKQQIRCIKSSKDIKRGWRGP